MRCADPGSLPTALPGYGSQFIPHLVLSIGPRYTPNKPDRGIQAAAAPTPQPHLGRKPSQQSYPVVLSWGHLLYAPPPPEPQQLSCSKISCNSTPTGQAHDPQTHPETQTELTGQDCLPEQACKAGRRSSVTPRRKHRHKESRIMKNQVKMGLPEETNKVPITDPKDMETCELSKNSE